ncbi:MAG: flagellar hook-length control protein FliK [Terriglobales bacterium]
MSPVMPAISENPTQLQAVSSKTAATGKAAVDSFSSELAKATDVSHPLLAHAATGESQGQGNTSIRMDNRRAPAASEHSTSEHSTSNTQVTTDSRQPQVAQTTVAPIVVPTAGDIPLAATGQIAFEADNASSDHGLSDHGSSVYCSSPTQTADASSVAAPSMNSAGFLFQSPALGSQFPVTSSGLLTENPALGTFEDGTSTVELANSSEADTGTVPGGTVPSALFSRPADSDGELATAIANSGAKPGTSDGTQASTPSSLKAAVGIFPIHATDRDISSESGIHKQPKQGTDIPADANHAPKVSQSLNDITKIDTTKIDSTKVANPKTDNGRADTTKADTRVGTSTESASSESGKVAQPSGDGKSDHGVRHEGSIAAPSGVNSDGKGIQQSSGQSNFANAIGAQTSGADSAKATDSSTAALTDSGVRANAASLHSSKPTDVDGSEQQAVEGSPLSALQSAKLVERAGQAELRVGFQAGELGSVDIRTSMAHNQVSAEISVEHSELRNLLAVELPHLQEKLSAHQVTATNIVLNNQAGGGSADSRQAYRQIAQTPQRSSSGRTESETLPGVTSITESQIPSTQLDIHM